MPLAMSIRQRQTVTCAARAALASGSPLPDTLLRLGRVGDGESNTRLASTRARAHKRAVLCLGAREARTMLGVPSGFLKRPADIARSRLPARGHARTVSGGCNGPCL